MKVIAVFAALFALAVAAPQHDKDVQILRQESDNIGVDGYNYLVETSDGQLRREEGVLNNIGAENEALSVRGEYSYVGPDNVIYKVVYIADENGFQPQGAHLPQSV